MVKLKTPLKLNDKVAKVRLPERNSQPKGIVSTAGWGITASDQLATISQTIDLKIIDDHECELAMDPILKLSTRLIMPNVSLLEKEKLRKSLKRKFLLSKTSVCTSGSLFGGKGLCNVSFISKVIV